MYVSVSQYFAVSDSSRKVYSLSINLNFNNGFITSFSFISSISLALEFDNNGTAYHFGRNSSLISDEGSHPTGGFI